ncbi:alpha/beta hydrolase [Kribbella monticola]|uniref:alpha/beta hydrolase n=1 Tax=Kribbella monticola TaxID=2185285 RepID=UPI001E499394|nr:alpha/beta hydrolase [Kribbella monticola]
MLLKPSRTIAWAALLGIASTGAAVVPAIAEPPPTVAKALQWKDCQPEPGDTEEDKELIKGSQCATLQVPIDWNHPAGPTFALAVARRTAKETRVGSLIFGPGGPGDSGVDRIRTGMSRFSAELQNRFDIVSFDPRGIARSNPVKCSAALLAQQPSPIIGSQAEFDRTIAYNRKLAEDCKANTGPLYDHIDTLQTVQDLNAIRIALGESQLTFHGSSYGTLLGEQYAERYPRNVRAIVLESVFDHGAATTRQFLDAQSTAAQNSFDEFVKWCDSATTCALHGRDVHALWADLLARAGRGELPDPQRPQYATTPFFLSFAVFRLLYTPQWAKLGEVLKQLDESEPPTAQPPVPSGLQANTIAPFCRDFSLPVRDYREFAGYLKRLARNTPDFKYPGQLIAVTSCLGLPPAPNPQRSLAVRHLTTPILLSNAIHDPATGYNWATDVAHQLGRNGVLLTYQGWGHGSYNKSPCVQATIDKYLVSLQVPPRGTSCPAVQPTG